MTTTTTTTSTTFLWKLAAWSWLSLSLLSRFAVADYDLQISEVWPGQAGDETTEDWFELFNNGTTAWVAATDGDLYYDDERADANGATVIGGLTTIEAGQVAVVVFGIEDDANDFVTVWTTGTMLTFDNVAMGYTIGQSLSASGDSVTIWVGDPTAVNASNGGNPVAQETYPSTLSDDGASYDFVAGAFSVAGTDDAVSLTGTGSSPVVASPGLVAVVMQDDDDGDEEEEDEEDNEDEEEDEDEDEDVDFECPCDDILFFNVLRRIFCNFRYRDIC